MSLQRKPDLDGEDTGDSCFPALSSPRNSARTSASGCRGQKSDDPLLAAADVYRLLAGASLLNAARGRLIARNHPPPVPISPTRNPNGRPFPLGEIVVEPRRRCRLWNLLPNPQPGVCGPLWVSLDGFLGVHQDPTISAQIVIHTVCCTRTHSVLGRPCSREGEDPLTPLLRTMRRGPGLGPHSHSQPLSSLLSPGA